MDELPYDFSRKRLSILFENNAKRVLITKGALPQILSICSEVETRDGHRDGIDVARKQIEEQWR